LAMILLEPGNRILASTVGAQIKPPEVLPDEAGEAKSARQPIDIKFCDFDDVSYRVVIEPADTSVMKVSMALPCYKEIANNGAAAAVEKAYPGLVTTPSPSFDVTLSINLDSLPSSLSSDELIQRISLLKNIVVGGVFEFYFSALLSSSTPQSLPPFKFSLRSDTIIYFIPKNDRVTVIFSLDFTDPTDLAIAKIFMQEFVEAKRKLGGAPPCTFSANPPLELKEFNSLSSSSNRGCLGYINFAVLKNHLEGGKKEKVISVLQVFRTYLQYHIKCSKSYFHAKMRARAASLLKILTRAKQDTGEEKEKKTITGKTFVRS